MLINRGGRCMIFLNLCEKCFSSGSIKRDCVNAARLTEVHEAFVNYNSHQPRGKFRPTLKFMEMFEGLTKSALYLLFRVKYVAQQGECCPESKRSVAPG